MEAKKKTHKVQNNPEYITSDFKWFCTNKQQKQHPKHKTDMWINKKE